MVILSLKLNIRLIYSSERVLIDSKTTSSPLETNVKLLATDGGLYQMLLSIGS